MRKIIARVVAWLKSVFTSPKKPQIKFTRRKSPAEMRRQQRLNSREHKRWENGWKRHCATRSQIRRIGSRKRAIELGIIPAKV